MPLTGKNQVKNLILSLTYTTCRFIELALFFLVRDNLNVVSSGLYLIDVVNVFFFPFLTKFYSKMEIYYHLFLASLNTQILAIYKLHLILNHATFGKKFDIYTLHLILNHVTFGIKNLI